MDIRLVRGRSSRVWLWIGLLAGAALLVWAGATFVFGDATLASRDRRVGADANFGADRAAVLPRSTESFEELLPLESRELGRLLTLRATAESPVRADAVWARTPSGRRILVRFEPAPPEGALSGVGPGTTLEVEGYLEKISQAEFEMWTDTLGVRIPRPPAGVKFGDVPDPAFARIDSLFIKNFYISVRPTGIAGRASPGGVAGEEDAG